MKQKVTSSRSIRFTTVEVTCPTCESYLVTESSDCSLCRRCGEVWVIKKG